VSLSSKNYHCYLPNKIKTSAKGGEHANGRNSDILNQDGFESVIKKKICACRTEMMALWIVLAELLSDGHSRSRSPSLSGVRMRPAIAVEYGNAESDTTFILVSGQKAGSCSLVRKPSDVSESFHDPGQLWRHHPMHPSAAKQIVPVTKTECSQPLYMAFCRSALDGCWTYRVASVRQVRHTAAK